MSVSFFLFLSLIFALLILFFSCKTVFKNILSNRRKAIITETVRLQKDLKFLQLERKKSYSDYLLEQSKYENWKKEAQSSYLMFYDYKKNIFEASFEEETKRKALIFVTKSKEQKILLLNEIILLTKDNLKRQKLNFKMDFVNLIKNVSF